jgi:hypothetical protein
MPPAKIHPISGVGDVLTYPDISPVSGKRIDEVLRASALTSLLRKSIFKSPYPPFSKWGTEGMEPSDFVNE